MFLSQEMHLLFSQVYRVRENHHLLLGLFLLKHKEDISKAYFNCHTDITIPYDELGAITVVRADGTTTDIIRNGRFVVPGTEPLNEPLDAMEP